MKLAELLKELDYECVGNKINPDTAVSALCYDNRKVTGGSVFVAVAGAKFDGHDYADEALKKGAVLVVTEHPVDGEEERPVIRVKSTRMALSLLSAAWFGYPARSLTTIAVTGTKGKSTTAYMIRNILQSCGHKTGIIGTIGVGIGDEIFATNNTTPESYITQEYLRKMVDSGCDSLVMEVSSQALKQHRVGGIIFDYALFTNLEPDHIGENEHADFEEYMYCKSLLFRQCRFAVGNADDGHFDDVVRGACAAPGGFEPAGEVTCPVCSFGVSDDCDVKARNISLLGSGGNIGIGYTAEAAGRSPISVNLSIPGNFNVYNSLAAITVTSLIFERDGMTDYPAKALNALYETTVRGRLEPVKISDRFTLMIDYAHNSMALESLLRTLREYNPGRLVCLFGCGGNRSKERRYEMGEVSSKMADLTVVTSDNPRFEKPMDIINDILIGVTRSDGKYIVIPNRIEAIRYVIEHAEDNDLIVLAGKGQEDYQEIEGVKYHMDEREIVADIAKSLGLIS